MTFPTIPTQAAGRLGFVNQLDTTATLTGPNLNTLTMAPGDLLIAIAGEYQSNAGADAAYTGWAGGGLTWTEIRDSTGTADNRLGVAYARVVTGSETGTVTVTRSGTLVGDASMVVLVVPGAHPTAAPEATVMAVATNAAADPAALTPSWGAADTLWIGVNGNGMTSITGTWTANNSAPTNYTDYFGTAPVDTSTIGDFGLAVAFRQLNAASEDVGAFGQDTTNARSAALAIAVRPSPNVTVTAGLASGTGTAYDVATPLRLANDFEGSTDGAAITTTGSTGDPWDATASNLGTGTYSAADAIVGSRAGRFVTTAASNSFMVRWTTSLGTRPSAYFRAYFTVPTLVTTIWLHVSGFDGTTNSYLRLQTSGTSLRVLTSADVVDATFTTALTAGQPFRVEWFEDVAGDSYEVRLFTGANLNGTTPTETQTGTMGYTRSSVSYADFGINWCGAAATAIADGVGVSTVDWLGPLGASGTNAPAGAATGSGSALDASVSLGVQAEAAAGTGAAGFGYFPPDFPANFPALGGIAAVSATAEVAAGTGAAYDATVSTTGGTSATAAVAAGAGSAFDAQVEVGTQAAAAIGSGSAPDASGGLGATAEVVTATGQALDSVAVVSATAAVAAGAGSAFDATVSTAATVNASADVASGTGQALDAVALVGGAAGAATGTGLALDASTDLAATAGPATAAGTALDAQAGVGGAAEVATATGQALDTTGAVAPTAEAATGTGTALDATVSTAVTVNAPADVATGAGAALDASVHVQVGAAVATAAGTALDATAQRATEAPAGVAAGTGTALDTAAGVAPTAGVASGAGEALDAAVYVPPPVPPPRWVEGASAGSGEVEGVLVGAGIVEGGSSL